KAVIELLLSAAQEGCEGIYDKASRPQAVEGSQEGLDIRTHPSPLQRLEVDDLHFPLLLESFKVHAEPEHVSLQAAYVLLERREDGRFPQPLRRVVDELGGEDRLARSEVSDQKDEVAALEPALDQGVEPRYAGRGASGRLLPHRL